MSRLPARREEAQIFVDILPFSQELKMEMTDFEPGKVGMSMPYDPAFQLDDQNRRIHGGAITALLDSCCGTAVIGHEKAPVSVATIDLRIDYIGSAREGRHVRALASVDRLTRHVAFVRAEAYEDGDDGRLFARAQGSFTVDFSQLPPWQKPDGTYLEDKSVFTLIPPNLKRRAISVPLELNWQRLGVGANSMSGLLGVEYAVQDGRIIYRMPYAEKLIGNPILPALHGGAMSAFAEIAARLELATQLSGESLANLAHVPDLPTINVTVDYLRPGGPDDLYAEVTLNRVGRRFASVLVKTWQADYDKPTTLTNAHFLTADFAR